jgi:hypothetical protein
MLCFRLLVKRMTCEAFNTKAALTKSNKSLDLFAGKMILYISNEILEYPFSTLRRAILSLFFEGQIFWISLSS